MSDTDAIILQAFERVAAENHGIITVNDTLDCLEKVGFNSIKALELLVSFLERNNYRNLITSKETF